MASITRRVKQDSTWDFKLSHQTTLARFPQSAVALDFAAGF